MFINSRNIPITLNGRNFLVSDMDISQSVELSSPYKIDDRVSTSYLPKSNYAGDLKIKYYLTGSDYLKGYIYSSETQLLSGNIGGLLFIQGVLNSYNISCVPNNPVEVNVGIQIFDKISGTFAQSAPQGLTGKILNLSDVSIDSLSSYTTNVLSNITQANFNYSANVSASYKITNTGEPEPTKADRIAIKERTITAEITSDNKNINLPLSGENYGLILTFQNPYNTSSETFGVSGRINQKSISLSNNSTHLHTIRIAQSHLTVKGDISGVITGANTFAIFSTNDDSHPFTSVDDSLQYVNRIQIGDTLVTGYTITKHSTYDSISCPIPENVTNDILTIYATHNTFIRNTPVVFDYPAITINNLTTISGKAGMPLDITGTNFYRLDRVTFGSANAPFKAVSPTVIQTVIPIRGTTNKINVISSRRNKTGVAGNLFFCEPTITTMTPVTGLWLNTLTIGGINLSGTTGVLFGTGVPANSFSVLSNVLMTIVTPQTGAGFPGGYVIVLTSGGTTRSLNRYNPQVPTFSFTPLSGTYGENVTIYTKWDRDYLSISGARTNQLDGFKVRFGNIDTVFYISGGVGNIPFTGAITGRIPTGAIDDRIYLYQPNGTETHNPHTGIFNVIADPLIYSFTPANINRYGVFNATLFGRNFKYFFGKPFYLALSGGLDNDVQRYTNVISNSGGAADNMFVPNIIITGNTGIYSAIVQNFAGTAVLSGALNVFVGINKARFQPGCVASTNGDHLLTRTLRPVSLITDGSTQDIVINEIEYTERTLQGQLVTRTNMVTSDKTASLLKATTTASGNYFQLIPRTNSVIDVSLIKIFMTGNLGTVSSHKPNPSGGIGLFHKNVTLPFYYTPIVNISGTNGIYVLDLGASGFTGVRNIRVFTPGVFANDTEMLAIREIEIY